MLQIKVVEHSISHKKDKWAHMSISPGSGAMGLERLIFFKYYIVLKWESRFTFGLNTAKITDYIKRLSCSEFNFVQKSLKRTCLCPPGVELWGSKD